MQRHTIRGADLAVRQSGDGDRNLVFVHGFQSDHTVWNPLIDRLDAGVYRFTTFDLAGCGASGNPESWQRCTIEEYAADLLALCDALGIEEPVVIGHSLGGAIALSAALARPDRVAATVLLAPASTTGLDFLPDEASFRALAYPTSDQKRALAARLFRHPIPDDEFEQIMAVVERASAQHNEGAAKSMRAFDIQPRLAGIACPTILVCGDRDRHMLPRNHLATWAAIPRCGLQVYYDIAHMPFVEAADACAADIARFLAKLG